MAGGGCAPAPVAGVAAGGATIYHGGFLPLPPASQVSRLFSRPDFRSGLRDMIPPLIGIFPFGIVCGVAAQAAGFTLLEAMGMALVIFSGSAQIIATQLLVAGAPFAVIVVTCFVIGLRLMMYSAAIAPHLRELPSRWRGLLAFVLTDQAFAASIRRFRDAPRPAEKASYLLGNGVVLWVSWAASNCAGFLAGNVIPADWSLDFVVPLCFLALLVPALEDGPTLAAAFAAGVAVLLFDALPMRLSLVCAGLVGIAVGVVAARLPRWRRR